jgi:hypothetical protein
MEEAVHMVRNGRRLDRSWKRKAEEDFETRKSD